MAEQRSQFRFRFPWSQGASAPRPTTPRPPAQPTASTTPAPAPRRAAETQVPSQPTSTTSPTLGQSTGSATPAPQRTAETQVPSQPTPITTRTPTPPSVDTETPTQPTIGTATTTMTPQTQPTTTMIPSSTTPQQTKTEAPSPTIATKAPIPENTQTAQTQPPRQSTTPTISTPANTQTAQTKPPNQPAATATATVTTSEKLPFRPPGATAPQASLPQPQASRSESQPSSPSRVTSEPQVSPQLSSPSRATTQSRSSEPSTPSRAATQSRATSLSSPSRTGSQNSPTPRKTSQSRPQPRAASRRKDAQVQPTTATLAEFTVPSEGDPRLRSKSFQPSSSSTDNLSSTLEKEPKSTVSEQQSLEQLQPSEESKSAMIYDTQKQTPVEKSTEPNGSPQTSVPVPVPTKKSDTPTRSSGPESFPDSSKPEETKEVKEIMQETREKTYKEATDKDDYLLTGGPDSATQIKEQQSFIYQSEQPQQAVNQKEVMSTPASNGKETTTTAQPKSKTVSMESRQKPALTNRENIPLHKEIRDDISKLVQKMASEDSKQQINDRPVTVITLAGENRGATMQLGTDSMKTGVAIPIQRGYKVNPDEIVEATTDGEGNSKARSEDTKDIEDQASEAFVNSNVQGINNSIMFNSSITERNPGVHLVHSCFPIKLKTSAAETEFLERGNRDFSTIHAQRLTYEPTVRRRCLRGLFEESSDTDPENTTKPRRHGCRVGCKEKSKENKTDAF